MQYWMNVSIICEYHGYRHYRRIFTSHFVPYF